MNRTQSLHPKTAMKRIIIHTLTKNIYIQILIYDLPIYYYPQHRWQLTDCEAERKRQLTLRTSVIQSKKEKKNTQANKTAAYSVYIVNGTPHRRPRQRRRRWCWWRWWREVNSIRFINNRLQVTFSMNKKRLSQPTLKDPVNEHWIQISNSKTFSNFILIFFLFNSSVLLNF